MQIGVMSIFNEEIKIIVLQKIFNIHYTLDLRLIKDLKMYQMEI